MEINISDMVWAVINFGIMAFVLTKFLYKPVLRVLDQRRDKILSTESQTQTALVSAEANLASAQQQLLCARQEAESIMEQALKNGELHRQNMLDAADESSREMLKNTKIEIEREHEKLQRELQSEVVRLSMEVTRHLVGSSLEEAQSRRLISSFIEELDIPTTAVLGEHATLSYSTKPDDTQLLALRKKLDGRFGKDTKLTLTHRPELLGGLSLQLGDTVLDGSLSNKIARLQAGLLQSQRNGRVETNEASA